MSKQSLKSLAIIYPSSSYLKRLEIKKQNKDKKSLIQKIKLEIKKNYYQEIKNQTDVTTQNGSDIDLKLLLNMRLNIDLKGSISTNFNVSKANHNKSIKQSNPENLNKLKKLIYNINEVEKNTLNFRLGHIKLIELPDSGILSPYLKNQLREKKYLYKKLYKIFSKSDIKLDSELLSKYKSIAYPNNDNEPKFNKLNPELKSRIKKAIDNINEQEFILNPKLNPNIMPEL